MRRPTRLNVAYVSAQLPSYLVAEHRVVERSRDALAVLGERLGFDLVGGWDPITSREHAKAVAAEVAQLGADLVLLQCSSFAMGDVVAPFVDGPFALGLWAPGEPTSEGPIPLNGFVAMHLHAGIARAVTTRGTPVKWFFGMDDHPWLADRLAVTIAALRGVRALRGARVALVGGVAPSFWTFHVDGGRLRRHLAVEVIDYDLERLIIAMRRVDASDVQATVAAMRAGATAVTMPDDDLRTNAAVVVALRSLIRDGMHEAVAIADWPRFQEALGIHPGAALSWIDECDAVPIAAEGDVLGAMSMLLARGLSGRGAMLLDVVDVDVRAGALLAWHCGGSPLSFADERGVVWDVHTTLARTERGEVPRGGVADLRFRRGPVTLMRLRDDGRELFTLDADVVGHDSAGFDGSRGWLGRFRNGSAPVAVGDVVNTLMSSGVEHHLALSDGAVGEAAREAAAWAGMRLTRVVPYRDGLGPQLGGER